ncbi:unnamed protein product [Ilex paraguariensis]|uniref:Uncharacterized protein n=1 Tax=Ilex paraguariensis TaxID=185542 RepID=A0ABC8RQ81_9AQUA
MDMVPIRVETNGSNSETQASVGVSGDREISDRAAGEGVTERTVTAQDVPTNTSTENSGDGDDEVVNVFSIYLSLGLFGSMENGEVERVNNSIGLQNFHVHACD